MTDKELLELAAKAAGIEITAVVADGIPHRFGGGYWNPLKDDGDALRLACDLALQVFPVARTSSGAACSAAASVTGERLAEFADASVGVREATRRAIVRAAAEIGRNME